MFTITRKMVRKGAEAIWNKYPHAKNISADMMRQGILYTLINELNDFPPSINDLTVMLETINEHLQAEVKEKRMFFIPRGRNGGFHHLGRYSPEEAHKLGINLPETLRNPPTVHPVMVEQTSFLHVPPEPQVAINDHVCPCCGNDRVSKSEKSCWKCGGKL